MSVDRTIGLIGIGLMGTAIAHRLLEHGYRVLVWNRNHEEGVPSVLAAGASWSDNPFAACDRVVISLYSSEVVAEAIGRMGGSLRPGQVVVDTTTGEPNGTIALGEQLAKRGIHYLDAPISGSSEQTRRGEATVMVGGDRSAFEACADLWPVLGQTVYHVGGCGAGARMKLASNLVLGLNRAALAEGLAFADAMGIAPASALEVFRGSNAYSKAMDVKGQKMIEGDFSAQARLSQHLKDVNLMMDAARAAGVEIPLAATHAWLLEKAVEAGWGDLDNSAIIKVLRGDGS